MIFPLAAIIYIFNGTIALWYGLRNFRTWRRTKNEYSLMFFRVGLGVAIAEFLYGFPPLLSPANSYLNGLFFLFAFFPLFIGLNYALRGVLKTWDWKNIEKLAAFLIPLAVLIFFLSHLRSIPLPYMFTKGFFKFIDWNVLYPYNLIWAAFLLLTTIVPGIYFLLAKADTRKVLLKKILFGITFVTGGLSGVAIVVFSGYHTLIGWAFVIQFIGFSILGSIFLADVLTKE